MCKHLQGASSQGMPKLPTQRPSMGAEERPNSSSNPSASLSPCRLMPQVWAANETSAVLANTLTFNTLEGLLTSIERTFGDLDKERMACAQFHTLRMTPGMTA